MKPLIELTKLLRQADHTHQFIQRKDASSFDLGAALLQGGKPKDLPIELASRLLTDPERNYTTTEWEALAVVWAVKKFRG